MRLVAHSIVLLAVAGGAYGQVDVNWEQAFGSRYRNAASEVLRLGEGQFLMAGFSGDYIDQEAGRLDATILLVGFRDDGGQAWQTSVGGTAERRAIVNDLVSLESDRFALAGYRTGLEVEDYAYVNQRAYLAVVDSLGNLLWDTEYDAGSYVSVIAADNGASVVAHQSIDEDSSCVRLRRLSRAGDIEWEERMLTGEFCDWVVGGVSTVDGFLWLGSRSTGSRSDLVVTKTDTFGRSEWETVYNRSPFDHPLRIVSVGWNRFLLLSDMSDGASLWSHASVVMIDASGNELWEEELDFARVNDADETENGDYIVVGRTAMNDILLARIDSSGSLLWRDDFGTDNFEAAQSVTATSPSEFIVVGENYHFDASTQTAEGSDAYVVSFTDATVPTALANAGSQTTMMLQQNYPNPFRVATTVSFTLPESGFAKLEVFSLTGRLIATPLEGYLSAGPHDVEFSATAVPAGVYFYRMQTGSAVEIRDMTVVR